MTETNPFAVAAQTSGNVQIAQSRAAQETQAAMVIAKRFPRNEEQAIQRIQRSCQRKSLAEVACYAYPRGGTTVTGPSIRLAECLAQNWSNMEFGVVELEQKNGESTVLAFAWDLETNTRETKVFQVKHERRVGKGDNFRIDVLTDPRDIYEMVANQGARRLRSCILGVIPGDVVDIAVEQCEKTLASGSVEPLLDRVRKMAAAFADYGVTVIMLERRLGHKLDATIEQELVNLRKIYTSLKDGMAKREDFFDLQADQSEPKSPKFDDAKAESAAGLAPVPAGATVRAPEPKKKGARSSLSFVETPPQPEPEPAPTPGAPGPGTPEPEPEPAEPAKTTLFPVPEAVHATPYDAAMSLLRRDDINEEEVLAFLKRKKFTADTTEELMQVADNVLIDMAVPKNWAMVAAQCRIDRRKKV